MLLMLNSLLIVYAYFECNLTPSAGIAALWASAGNQD